MEITNDIKWIVVKFWMSVIYQCSLVYNIAVDLHSAEYTTVFFSCNIVYHQNLYSKAGLKENFTLISVAILHVFKYCWKWFVILTNVWKPRYLRGYKAKWYFLGVLNVYSPDETVNPWFLKISVVCQPPQTGMGCSGVGAVWSEWKKEVSLSLSWSTWSAKKKRWGLNYMCDAGGGAGGWRGKAIRFFCLSLWNPIGDFRYITI